MQSPLETLRQYWGYESFRPLQKEIISAVLEGRDTLALLPTGGGKSICFQVPGMCMEGLTLVISPLIALMKDQVERLQQQEIPATFINSSLTYTQIDQRLQGAMEGQFRFLYLAPERLRSPMFADRLPKMPVRLLAVDEAHCISQWGYDFRPDYLEIHQLREHLPQVPVIALTASATKRVQEDIVDKLQLKDAARFAGSFRRENLRFFALKEENVTDRIMRIAQRAKGSGIIYTRTRKRCEVLARSLQEAGHSALAYHGGMVTSQRNKVQQSWLEGQTRIIVATNAFGMGIDKPDVRWVVHYNLPFDLESYYQEAGRGGRDGEDALAICFDNRADKAELGRWNARKYPEWEDLTAHYEQLCDYLQIPVNGGENERFEIDLSRVARDLKIPAAALYQSLKLLHREGLVYFEEESDDFAWLQIMISPNEVLAYKEAHPSLAPFIDFILRQLGGAVYSEPRRFLPESWAHRMDQPPLELHYWLERMAKMGMVQYLPANGMPTLTLLQPRHKLQPEELNWEKYTFLQNQNDRRLTEMIDYVENTEVCRSLLIQQYFGEETKNPCGRCDVCSGRFRTKVDDEAYREIQSAFVALLKENPVNYRDALLGIKTGTPAQREKVLRYLMDKEIILADKTGLLRLARKK